jgi:hypothetical protein
VKSVGQTPDTRLFSAETGHLGLVPGRGFQGTDGSVVQLENACLDFGGERPVGFGLRLHLPELCEIHLPFRAVLGLGGNRQEGDGQDQAQRDRTSLRAHDDVLRDPPIILLAIRSMEENRTVYTPYRL